LKKAFGLAKSADQAASIVDQLKVAGFSNSDISVLSTDRAGTRHVAHEQHNILKRLKAPRSVAVAG